MNATPPNPLDRLLREAVRRLAEDGHHPEESTLIAYLAGTATEHQIQTVRRAVLRSPTLREELVELDRVMERLSDPQLGEDFDRIDPGRVPSFEGAIRSPAPERRGPRRFLGRWALLAYAAGIALLAVPTYRVLAPQTAPQVALYLREDLAPLRGTASDDLPRLTTPAEGSTNINLTLELPTPHTSLQWVVSVTDASGKSQGLSIPEGVEIIEGSPAIRVSVRAESLHSGPVTIQIAPATTPGHRTSYRFFLVKGE